MKVDVKFKLLFNDYVSSIRSDSQYLYTSTYKRECVRSPDCVPLRFFHQRADYIQLSFIHQQSTAVPMSVGVRQAACHKTLIRKLESMRN